MQIDDELRIEIVRDETRFLEVVKEWQSLFVATPGSRFSCCPYWNHYVWQNRDNRTSSLCIWLAWRGLELIAVLPMHRYLENGIKFIEALSQPGERYSASLLVARTEDQRHVVKVALQDLANRALGSILRVKSIFANSPLAVTIGKSGGLQVDAAKAPQIHWELASGWDDYLAGRPQKSLPSKNRYERNRLSKIGALSIAVESDRYDKIEVLNWLEEKKFEWLRSRNETAPSDLKYSFKFMRECVLHENLASRIKLFSLRLDGKPIAALIVTSGTNLLELKQITYDATYAKYSPGRVLVQELVEHAFEANSNLSFGIGVQDYKLKWSNSESSVVALYMPLDAKGRRRVFAQKLGRSFRYYRSRVRDVLRKCFARPDKEPGDPLRI